MEKKSTKSKNLKKRNANLFGAACVVLGLLIVLIAFLVKKDQISKNLKETAFFDRVFGTTPTFIENQKDNTKKTAKENESITFNLNNDSEGDGSVVEKSKETQKITINDLKGQPKKEASKENQKEISEEVKKETETEKVVVKTEKKEEVETSKVEKTSVTTPEEKKVAKPATTDLQLCFVMIDADGLVVRKMTKRTVQKSDSPLTNAITLLLKGPDNTISGERDLKTFIPKGTRLLGARVSNGVAILNFSEDFEFNSEGTIGLRNQLMQVVYTATAFSTVNSVQFLIEGQKTEYLGSEGIWIGSPLSKTSF